VRESHKKRRQPDGGILFPVMEANGLTPILNVSDMAASFAWFEKWGWKKLWDWGTPPTFQQDGDEEGDKGVWMSVWVDDVDAMHKHCIAAGLEITFPPTDMPWNVREMHLRHPDGHVFRVGRGIEKSSSVGSALKAHVSKITRRRAPGSKGKS